MTPRKNAETTRGRPFEPGNAGRPKGARNKATIAAEALLDGDAENITKKAIELAKAGDLTAIRLCMERIVPPRKDRPVSFELPAIQKAADCVAALAAIADAVGSGDLTPMEAAELSKVVNAYTRAVEVTEIMDRLERLEKAQEDKGK